MAGKSRKTEPAAPLAQRKAAGAKDASTSKPLPFAEADDLSVDDFIDAHLKERPKSKAPGKRDPASKAPPKRMDGVEAKPSPTRSEAQAGPKGPKKITRDQVYKPVKTPGNWDESPNDAEEAKPAPASAATRPVHGLTRTPIPREDPNSLRPKAPPRPKPITPKPPSAATVSSKELEPADGAAPLRRTASIRAAANEERISHLEDEIEQLRWDLKQARDSAAELIALAAQNVAAQSAAARTEKAESPEDGKKDSKPPGPAEPESATGAAGASELDLSAMIAETIEPVGKPEPTEITDLAAAIEPDSVPRGESPVPEVRASDEVQGPEADAPSSEEVAPPRPPLVVEETPDPAAHTPERKAPATRRRSPVVLVVAGAALLLVALAGLGFFLQPTAEESDPIVVDVKAPPKPVPAEADDPEADEPKPVPAEADEPEADKPEANEPEADEPEADEPASDAPGPDEVVIDDTDGGDLLSYQGYLTVRSTKTVDVYVQGKLVGKTNTKLMARCGPRNVRIAEDGPKWLSPGRHVRIKCMAATTVSIEPSP